MLLKFWYYHKGNCSGFGGNAFRAKKEKTFKTHSLHKIFTPFVVLFRCLLIETTINPREAPPFSSRQWHEW
jgi:hypothetical protein